MTSPNTDFGFRFERFIEAVTDDDGNGSSGSSYGALTQDVISLLEATPSRTWSSKAVAERLGYPSTGTVNSTLYRLWKRGRVHRVKPGRYQALSDE